MSTGRGRSLLERVILTSKIHDDMSFYVFLLVRNVHMYLGMSPNCDAVFGDFLEINCTLPHFTELYRTAVIGDFLEINCSLLQSYRTFCLDLVYITARASATSFLLSLSLFLRSFNSIFMY